MATLTSPFECMCCNNIGGVFKLQMRHESSYIKGIFRCIGAAEMLLFDNTEFHGAGPADLETGTQILKEYKM